ncbi:MAG: MerR family transcriptional regulator [Nocardioidaceae bacterium]
MKEKPTPLGIQAEAAAVLTIGQLAAHVGVTVRAIRHYHQLGLLGEPVRDRSGYRRYDAQAVAHLIRIKALANAGVPLGRIRELLDSNPAEFADAVTEIDQAIQQRISGLEAVRHELAGLMAGERLVLPAEVADLLGQMRSLGVSERTMTVERDGWTLLMALSPEPVPTWAADKVAALADPDFRRLYLAWEQAYDWEADDPRLVELAAQAAAWLSKQPASVPPPQDDAGILAVYDLLSAQVATESPAWRRLDELCRANLMPSGQSPTEHDWRAQPSPGIGASGSYGGRV